jgi:hypothetical protein
MLTLYSLFFVKELINKHINKELLLGSEKAYDSVWQDGIFFELIETIKLQFWIILKDYYDKSDGVLKINGKLIEEIVEITRGVKQGVLSPQLFNFFIDELLNKISIGIGCKIKEENVPIMCFCDDTILQANLLNQLKPLVDTDENYSKKWMLKYSFQKLVILNCGHQVIKDEDIDVKIDGMRLLVVKASKYLEIMINKENDDDKQTIEKFHRVQQCFYVLSSFGIKPPKLYIFLNKFSICAELNGSKAFNKIYIKLYHLFKFNQNIFT